MDKKIKEIIFYVKNMNEYSKQEIVRYVRGVYDGTQTIRRQYGLEGASVKHPEAGTGKTA
jgi:hypothetical protein